MYQIMTMIINVYNDHNLTYSDVQKSTMVRLRVSPLSHMTSIPAQGPGSWVALLVERYSSNTASFVLCVVGRVKDRHTLLHDSPLLKNTCIRLPFIRAFLL